jgi:hypothetical protein
MTLITSPAILVVIEAVFFYLITHESSVDLGYFSRFHQGLWLMLKALGAGVSITLDGLSAGLSVCCGRSGGDELLAPLSKANPSPLLQASPPPPYFVTALPSVSFNAHRDHIVHDLMAIDAVVLRDEGMV